MSFKNKAKPTIVYKYGARAPIENLDEVERQIRLAHIYRNNLIELELKRRKDIDEAKQEYVPLIRELTEQVERLKNEIETIRTEIRKHNQNKRKKAGTKEERQRIKHLNSELKETRKQLRQEQQDANDLDILQNTLKHINDTKNINKKKIYKKNRDEHGVYWGTLLQVDASVQLASQKQPRFRSFCGEGKLAVQIQKDNIPSQYFRIEPVPENAWDKGQPQSKKRTILWMRIGSVVPHGRTPIWIKIPFVMHRPLPEGKIQWVFLTKKRIGVKYKWHVCFVISRDEGWKKPDLAQDGLVGIDVGWRKTDNGIRVAYLTDGTNDIDLCISPKDVNRWQKAEDLRAVRDKNFNIIVDKLSEWLNQPHKEWPKWLLDQTATLKKWRSTYRLSKLVLYWRDNRFQEDEEIFELLEGWRKQDKHLYTWEANQRNKAIAWRKDCYRNLAAKLRRKYKTIGIEKIDLTQLKKRKKEEEIDYSSWNKYGQWASPGQLIKILKGTFDEVILVPPRNTSRKCSLCGNLMNLTREAKTTCNGCGTTWDRDHNAARNILSAAKKIIETQACEACEGSGDAKTPVTSRTLHSKDLGQSDPSSGSTNVQKAPTSRKPLRNPVRDKELGCLL